MGAEQSQVPNLKQFENAQGLNILKQQQWKSLGFKDDFRYGEVKLYQNQQGQQIALINKTCHNPQEYSQLSQKLQKGKELNQVNGIVQLLEIYTQEEGNLCSSFYKISAVYEYYSKTLQDYLNNHTQFETKSVELFFTQMVNILKVLYEQNIPHGDLRPQNIFITDNSFKLNNIQQMTGFNQYKRVLIDDEQRCYLSPELLTFLSRKDLRPNYDQQKADVYTLGLVLLELTLACDIQRIYNLENYQINQQSIDQLINQFGDRMGETMKNTIQQMLLPNVNSRPTFAQLLSLCSKQEHKPQQPQIAQNNSPAHQPIVNRSIFSKQMEKPKIKLLGSPIIDRNQRDSQVNKPVQQQQLDYGQQQMETAQFIQVKNAEQLKDQTNAIQQQKKIGNSMVSPPKPSFKKPRNDQNIFKPQQQNAKKIGMIKKK